MSAFDRIIGYQEQKRELLRYCDVMKNREKYIKLGVSIPMGILLEGEPGLGKSTIAHCFIEECGCNSYTIRKNMPDGDFVKHIRATFEKARENAPAIVFLDDLDKFANEDRMHRDAEEYVVTQACIDDCKDCGVMVIATVNDIRSLPDSLIRSGRFDKIILIEKPSAEDAVKILKYYLESKHCLGNIDVEEIAMIIGGFSCATVETVINDAGILAGYEGRSHIIHEDVLKACLREIYAVPESEDTEDEVTLKEIAIHEAGHAVIMESFKEGSVGLISISGSRYGKKGVTVRALRSKRIHSFKEKEQEVIWELGGKAATEIVKGRVDVGCFTDIVDAYEDVRSLADNICSFGFDSYATPDGSEYAREMRDRRITECLNKYYQEAKRILIANRDFLDAIVDGLMEKKTLTYKDILKIRARFVSNYLDGINRFQKRQV
ncbi:MAG: AAA family ATPase [Lachnospiraceae bacterium]|nr:AAA family ATPase [Lachnospiraceae bacterium]